MKADKIKELIAKKTSRKAILNARKEQLLTLEKELFSSVVGRFFSKIWYYVKRYVFLALGVLAILAAVCYFIYPSSVFGEVEKQNLLMKYKADYYEVADETIDDSFRKYKTTLVTVENSDTATTTLVRTLNESIIKTIEDEIKISYRYTALLLFIIGFLLLYVSVITKSIHKRNIIITKAESLAKEVIKDYILTIEEEDQELQLFKEMDNSKMNDNRQTPKDYS